MRRSFESGDWYYFLADGLGSTMAIVDDAGAVQNSYTYDVYGEPAVTGSLQNEFDFAGQQTDADTGLQYLRARYMDPETGVFFSRDPLAAVLSWLGSHFGYAGGNPATATDPTGLCDDGSPTCLGTENPMPAAPDGWNFWTWVDLEEPGPLMWLEWRQSGIGPYVRLCRLVGEYRSCGEGILLEKLRKAALQDQLSHGVSRLINGMLFTLGVIQYTSDVQQAFRHLQRFHGIGEETASQRLHDIKRRHGLRGDDDVLIGRTGDVYDAKTGEHLGSLTQGGGP